MGRKRTEWNLQMAPGLDGAIAIALQVFNPFAVILGVYFALSFFVMAIVLVFDLLKFVFTFLKVMFTKRPEGTSFIDALSYEIGRGEETKGLLAFGMLLAVIGAGLIIFSPKPEIAPGIVYAVSQNPMGVAGGLALGAGLAAIYWGLKGVVKKALFGTIYYEEPEVKKMKSEMMTAFKQGRTMDAINLFKMDLKTMTDQFEEADALKFDFHREEKELDGISAVFKRAEKYCKAGAMKEADVELNSARKRYEALRPRIANKLRSYGRVKETITELKHRAKVIESSLKECGRNSLKCDEEEEDYKKLDMNKVLLASESFWRDDNYNEALKELERFMVEYGKIRVKLVEKLERYNTLISRKYPCLKCGKNMNLANTACPSCGANSAETILEVMSESANKLLEQEKMIEGAKWLMNFDSEDDGLEEIQIALSSITKQVEKGELDRATSLLTSTKASQEALVSDTKEKLGLYEKLAGRINELKKKTLETRGILEQQKRDGIDVVEEETTSAKVNETASPGIIEGLCKSGSFSDASARLEKAIAEQDRVAAILSKKSERYGVLSALMASLEKRYKETNALVEQAKAKKIDVSIEERELRAVNLDVLAGKSKTLSKEIEKEIKDTTEGVNKARESMVKKVEMFSRLEGMGIALEEKMKELRALVSKGVALKLDIKEEHEKFYTIKIDRIREMLKSCDDIVTLKKELDSALDTAQWCIASLSDKLESVGDAGKWTDAINSAMKGADIADLDSLRGIPKDWRNWAVERYIESNHEDAFVVYSNKLIKTMSAEKKRRYEEILNEMLSSGKVRGCAILDDRGVVIASAFPEMKEPMPLGAPAVGVVDYGRGLAKAVGIAKPGQFVIGTDEFKAIISEIGRGVYLLCSLKPKENVAFASIVISGGMKKLQETAG